MLYLLLYLVSPACYDVLTARDFDKRTLRKALRGCGEKVSLIHCEVGVTVATVLIKISPQ